MRRVTLYLVIASIWLILITKEVTDISIKVFGNTIEAVSLIITAISIIKCLAILLCKITPFHNNIISKYALTKYEKTIF